MLALKRQSLRRRVGFALAGCVHGWRAERSVRLQALALLAVLGVLLFFRPAPVWWACAMLASAGVIAVEFLNTALEALADRLVPEADEAIRIVKDCAAAASLIAACGALGVAAAFVAMLLAR